MVGHPSNVVMGEFVMLISQAGPKGWVVAVLTEKIVFGVEIFSLESYAKPKQVNLRGTFMIGMNGVFIHTVLL